MSRSKCLLGAAVIALTGCGDNSEPPVATNVDLQRFEGQWYEIAHLPRPTQQDCTGTIATYRKRADGAYDFVHECTLAEGSYYGKTLVASVPDAKTPAKLVVDIDGFKGDYWILDVAPDYRYAVVGHPSRDYLWVLSRTQTMSPADHDAALGKAKSNGFDTARLQYTPLAPAPVGTPAPPVQYGVGGCIAVASHRKAPLGVLLGAAFAIGIAALRRKRRA